MKISLWASLRSTIFNKKDDKSEKNKKQLTKNALSGKLNVNEEYQQAFRTNSYIEFTTTDNTSSLSSSSSCPLEPDQELLNDMFRSSHVHHLLIDYFQASFEASKTCQILLQALHQTRVNHAIVNRVIKLTRKALMAKDNNNVVVYRELSSFSNLKNPFSIISHTQFLALHDAHLELLHKLTHKQNETRRKVRLRRIWKKAAKACLVISNAVVIVTLLVVALHSLVGVVVVPGFISCFLGLLKKKKRDCKVVSPELVLRQMEIAARVTYITMNDLDTLSRMAARLDVEVEHHKAIAEMWMRLKSSRRSEILKEAMKEIVAEDDAIVEQMKELQQHIYLCFHTINRSRSLVMNEIVGAKNQNG